MSRIDLRSYVFLDSLQPQYAAFLGTVAQGFLPLAKDASLFVEIAPGIEINRLTDVALKATHVRPGMQIIERYYGLLEVHSDSQAETRAAGQAILDEIGHVESDRRKPKILSSQVIRRIDSHQAQLVNRTRHGQMLIPRCRSTMICAAHWFRVSVFRPQPSLVSRELPSLTTQRLAFCILSLDFPIAALLNPTFLHLT